MSAGTDAALRVADRPAVNDEETFRKLATPRARGAMKDLAGELNSVVTRPKAERQAMNRGDQPITSSIRIDSTGARDLSAPVGRRRLQIGENERLDTTQGTPSILDSEEIATLIATMTPNQQRVVGSLQRQGQRETSRELGLGLDSVQKIRAAIIKKIRGVGLAPPENPSPPISGGAGFAR